jgi:hypothetical protein
VPDKKSADQLMGPLSISTLFQNETRRGVNDLHPPSLNIYRSLVQFYTKDKYLRRREYIYLASFICPMSSTFILLLSKFVRIFYPHIIHLIITLYPKVPVTYSTATDCVAFTSIHCHRLSSTSRQLYYLGVH